MSAFRARDRFISQTLILILIVAGISASIACGTGSSKSSTTTPPPPPPHPNFPSIPPEHITWPVSNPASSQFPAPPAEDETTAPWKNGSNDFPLSVSSPTASSTVTSPLNVVATATPRNPIFFMRVYVDKLAVYFTFNNSINTQIFLSTGAHTVTVMAEDKQGY